LLRIDECFVILHLIGLKLLLLFLCHIHVLWEHWLRCRCYRGSSLITNDIQFESIKMNFEWFWSEHCLLCVDAFEDIGCRR